jgi:hypothetical protein
MQVTNGMATKTRLDVLHPMIVNKGIAPMLAPEPQDSKNSDNKRWRKFPVLPLASFEAWPGTEAGRLNGHESRSQVRSISRLRHCAGSCVGLWWMGSINS